MISSMFKMINNNKYIGDWKQIINKTYLSYKENIKELYMCQNNIKEDYLRKVYVKKLVSLYHHLITINNTYNNNHIKYNEQVFNKMNNDIDEMLILIEGFESHKNVIHDIADVNIPLPIEIEQAYKLINSKLDQLS